MEITNIVKAAKLDKKARLVRLCELLPKQQLGQTTVLEDFEIEHIQRLRKDNGEIDAILEGRKKLPIN